MEIVVEEKNKINILKNYSLSLIFNIYINN